jgi:hypothetical protein
MLLCCKVAVSITASFGSWIWQRGNHGLTYRGAAAPMLLEHLHILDAKTGTEQAQILGDGGVGGFPLRPLLSNDERRVLALNGGTDMARLIDAKSGVLLACVQRRDGFIGEASSAPTYLWSA